MLIPIFALICWSLVLFLWLYATRIPAMQKAKIMPGWEERHPDTKLLDALPANVRCVADNYNHLHEQPTVFYALAFYTHLAGAADTVNIALAWVYVGLRVVHSLSQILVGIIPIRFMLFFASGLVLVVLAARNLFALTV